MKRHLFLVLALLFLIAPSGLVFAQVGAAKLSGLDTLSATERQARLLEGARAEGRAVIYLNLDTVVANSLANGFMKKYSGVHVQVGRFSGASIIARVESEARAGKLAADAIMSGRG